MTMDRRKFLFVYGTLMRGCGNDRLLAGATFLGRVRSAPLYRMLHLGGFPAIIEGDGEVWGELYELADDAQCARIDRLEGTPHLYRRDALRLADGLEVDAYFLQRPRGDERVIGSGDWRKAGPLPLYWRSGETDENGDEYEDDDDEENGDAP